ncbi:MULTISPECIES: hypothetical protein [Pseudomonas]|uniref:hypothetical protein n=1 Tax=Pseudomonas TaxID=286 RepID=UPI0002726231|nr:MULTISPECIES: hypothetical protein [Pseudomonas]WDH34323.1 hypothetical protein PUP62_26380 [Pseudomonas chlororaphis]WDH40407.1 hypothetical protein PUP51_26380 [Pseudomonas chlororaphis]WDH52258.1 hypothetical protein PUP75_25495 [Pseudomonas chlororaphis]WIE49439.1 hypothetical protein PMI20_027545 [Pseudomonas sp. GM17]
MSNVTTAEIVLVSFGCITFLGAFIMIGVHLYWIRTHLNEALAYFKNSKIVNQQRAFLYFGTWGKMALIGGIAGFLTYSGYFIKRGLLDADEVNNFPEPLKKKLIASHYILGGLLTSFFIEYIAMRLIR